MRCALPVCGVAALFLGACYDTPAARPKPDAAGVDGARDAARRDGRPPADIALLLDQAQADQTQRDAPAPDQTQQDAPTPDLAQRDTLAPDVTADTVLPPDTQACTSCAAGEVFCCGGDVCECQALSPTCKVIEVVGCPSGTTCVAGTCILGCSHDVDCPTATPHCDAGACVECLIDGDCPTAGDACIENGCCPYGSGCGTTCCAAPTPICGAGGVCVECIAATDCPADKVCDQDQCV